MRRVPSRRPDAHGPTRRIFYNYSRRTLPNPPPPRANPALADKIWLQSRRQSRGGALDVSTPNRAHPSPKYHNIGQPLDGSGTLCVESSPTSVEKSLSRSSLRG